MHCDMLKIQDGGAIVEKVNWADGLGTENIHTESYLSEKSVRCFVDCVCKWRVQMACSCLAAMFLASKCTCAV